VRALGVRLAAARVPARVVGRRFFRPLRPAVARPLGRPAGRRGRFGRVPGRRRRRRHHRGRVRGGRGRRRPFPARSARRRADSRGGHRGERRRRADDGRVLTQLRSRQQRRRFSRGDAAVRRTGRRRYLLLLQFPLLVQL